jgi:hypothetical protein
MKVGEFLATSVEMFARNSKKQKLIQILEFPVLGANPQIRHRFIVL